MSKVKIQEDQFIADLKKIVNSSRQFAYSAVNFAQVWQNWLIGQRIVLQEQDGKARAEYGKRIIEIASKTLTAEFGKGFSERSLWKYKQFYLSFSDIQILPTLSAELSNWKMPTVPAELKATISQALADQSKPSLPLLSWSHYERLMRVRNEEARSWYMQEAAKQMWSYRTLDRNISTLYYRRMLSSQAKEIVEQEMKDKTADFQQDKLEFIKNPSVLEFLGLPANKGYTESILEQAIIDQMQDFLLELGKGFSFVARQQLIRTETADFYIDIVFYNYILNCFVIVELKTHAITHQDIGQLDMYVRMYDDLRKGEKDNPTIGILLCTETDKTIARYSVLNENKQLFASQYIDYLPTEKQLEEEIERQKAILKLSITKGENQ
ncbi:MAG: PDDEXK nuclease domain-containing protein [Prevotellaceae bacterium]|jgi:predicted nuclease of restriction endonuclease-like (RecB) superfamily|nr:PDDEXK nuclease domain-containing protein [Prevotellaceae bacterium]